MNCECGGVLLAGKSSYSISEDSFTYILEDIPAFRCERCKKVLFTDETVTKIQKLTRKIKKVSSEIVNKQSSTKLYEY